MLTHTDVWRGIDNLAAQHQLSASGLARRAGLDPTTFNKSKRVTKEGKQRWPSTESLSKVLEATSATLSEFIVLMNGAPLAPSQARLIPSMAFDQARRPGLFDSSGHPNSSLWDQVLFPGLDDPAAYALEVAGDGLAPVFRDGDRLIVSPAADLRRGDRVVVGTRRGDLLVMRLLRQSAVKIELSGLAGDEAVQVLDGADVAWMCRLVWASQ